MLCLQVILKEKPAQPTSLPQVHKKPFLKAMESHICYMQPETHPERDSIGRAENSLQDHFGALADAQKHEMISSALPSLSGRRVN